jgi:uncharacterized protein YkwD
MLTRRSLFATVIGSQLVLAGACSTQLPLPGLSARASDSSEQSPAADDTTGRPKTVDTRPPSDDEPAPKKKAKKKTAAADPLEDQDDPDGDCYKAEDSICRIERQVFEIVQQERRKAGLGELEFSPRASFVARDWSQAQASRGRISHDGWPGEREALFQDEFGVPLGTDAENVAMLGGGSSSTVAKQLMAMWMGSPGHRFNILGRHGSIGIGIAKQGDEWYATQLFMLGTP